MTMETRGIGGAPLRIDSVALTVRDILRTEAFYRNVLGYHIALNTWRSRGAGRRAPNRAGLSAVTLGVAEHGSAERVRDPLEDPWGTHLRIGTSGAAETAPATGFAS
jgi:catechol-2,3-dioxygenase